VVVATKSLNERTPSNGLGRDMKGPSV
jgi:hypothetical protein